MQPHGPDDLLDWLLKVGVPSLAGAFINIAVMIKSRKTNFVSALLSIIIALSTVFIIDDWVLEHHMENSALTFGAISILSDRVWMVILTRLNWDSVVKRFIDGIIKLYTGK